MLKVVKFKGGLGNQLFQYTFLLNLKRICSREVIKGDFSYYKNLRGDNIRVPRIKELSIDIDEATNDDLQEVLLLRHNSNPKTLTYKAKVFLEKMLNKEYFFEPDRRYRAVNDLAYYSYFDGYWQSWMYVDSVEDKLKREIRLRKVFGDKTKRTIERIQTENAVMLCIRRGDYVATYRSRKHYGTLGTEYYNRAIQYILERVEHPIFYVFSNDVEWVKRNMEFRGDVVFRNPNDQVSDTEELFVMGSCKHAIIGNSTYHWWGAWLIRNNDKIVIAPKKWFADDKPIDIVPESWVKL